MDIVDRAQQMESRALKEAMTVHNRSRTTTPAAWLTHCEDCDREIPVKRRETVPGCTRCVTCQALFEDSTNDRR
jgi:phage/conjugal plasmid C-4 type zinc finger TraR family protein